MLHILGAVGIFVAFLISIAYKQVGIWALIAAWLIAMAIIGVAWITAIRKADLLKNGKIVTGKVNAVKRVRVCFLFIGSSAEGLLGPVNEQRQGITMIVVSCLLLCGIKFALCELGHPLYGGIGAIAAYVRTESLYTSGAECVRTYAAKRPSSCL